MNILFYTTFEVSPNKGGTERITTTISSALSKEYGWNCYSAYARPIDKFYIRSKFKDSICIYIAYEYDRMIQFLKKNNIDIIINQSDFNQSFHFKQIIEQEKLNCKLVFVHHFAPHFEIDRFPDFVKYIRLQNWTPYHFLKSLFYVATYHQAKKRNEQFYKNGYANTCLYSDKIVLLSSGFIDDFQKVAGISCQDKITVIHNALTYSSFFNMNNYHNKKNEVLVVSRLEEYQKRISFVLKIWKMIEQDNVAPLWSLRIIGTGEDEKEYKRYTKRHKLKRVSFEGAKEALANYQSASIFMMTSRSEGWGLTLTEAQQNACVPIAFNSYAAISDIITNNSDGFIINEGDIHSYYLKLKQLMTNNDMRQRMAKAAVVKSHEFAEPIIIKQWHDMLCKLMSPTQ